MAWLKALHVIFMVTWFAGLFYLPRLFVYHAGCTDMPGHQRFCMMERRLFGIMTLGAVVTAVFGFWLLYVYLASGWTMPLWMHIKLGLVVLLIGYHAWCYRLMKHLADGTNTHTERWYRWFNEAPALLLVAIVLLAVVKPF